MCLHTAQLAISINLESVLYLGYIVILPIRAVNYHVMNAKLHAMP
jgi:hypothetical protein